MFNVLFILVQVLLPQKSMKDFCQNLSYNTLKAQTRSKKRLYYNNYNIKLSQTQPTTYFVRTKQWATGIKRSPSQPVFNNLNSGTLDELNASSYPHRDLTQPFTRLPPFVSDPPSVHHVGLRKRYPP